jgi:predicted CoA-binding protein
VVVSGRDVGTILRRARTIAVVGLSGRPDRDSNSVARYLQAAGYRVIPVNPREEEVLGEKSYPSLRDVPEPIDIVDVFRRGEHTPPIAEDAVAAGAGALWLQQGIRSEESRRIAEEAGLDYVEDSCIRTVHRHLIDEEG